MWQYACVEEACGHTSLILELPSSCCRPSSLRWGRGFLFALGSKTKQLCPQGERSRARGA